MFFTSVAKKNLSFATINFFYWSSVYIFLPVIPILYTQMNVKSNILGLIVGGYSVGSILFRWKAVKIAETIGHSRALWVGLLVSFFSVFMYFFYKSWEIILIGRILNGIGSALFSVSALTMVTLLNKEDEIKESVAIYSLGITLGTTIATSIAIFLYYGFGFYTVIFVSVLNIMFAFYFFYMNKKKYTYLTELKMQKNKNIKITLLSKNIYIPFINQFTVFLCYGAIITFLPVVANQQNASKCMWIFYTIYAITVIISRLTVSHILKLVSTRSTVITILVILAVIILLLFQHISIRNLIIIGGLLGVTVGLSMPVFASLVALNTQASDRTRAMGIFSISPDLGFVSGTIFMGILTMKLSYSMIFLLLFIVIIFVLGVYVNSIKKFKY